MSTVDNRCSCVAAVWHLPVCRKCCICPCLDKTRNPDSEFFAFPTFPLRRRRYDFSSSFTIASFPKGFFLYHYFSKLNRFRAFLLCIFWGQRPARGIYPSRFVKACKLESLLSMKYLLVIVQMTSLGLKDIL